MQKAVNTAKKYLLTLRNSVGKIHGGCLEKMLWIWNCVIKPSISYGSLIWATRLTKGFNSKFIMLQRLALTLVGHIRKSTLETDSMWSWDRILWILEQAFQARLRTKTKSTANQNGKGTRNRKNHYCELNDIIEEQGLTDLVDDQSTKLE